MRLDSINFANLGHYVDIDALRDDALKEEYRLTARSESYHSDTTIVFGLHTLIDGYEFCNNDMMDKYAWHINSLASTLKDSYGYNFIQLTSFNFIKLKAGGEITEHTDDKNEGYSYNHRVHIPIQTDGNVVFEVGGERRNMKYGEIIEIDNLKSHSVKNNSTEDRVHLVLDFYGLYNLYNNNLPDVPTEFYKEK